MKRLVAGRLISVLAWCIVVIVFGWLTFHLMTVNPPRRPDGSLLLYTPTQNHPLLYTTSMIWFISQIFLLRAIYRARKVFHLLRAVRRGRRNAASQFH